MALGIDKRDVPRRDTDGLRAIAMPETGLPESPVRLATCAGCPKEAAHNPATNIRVDIPFGEIRHQRVDSAERFDVESFDRIQSALFALHVVVHGYIGDEIAFNVGNTADNASQAITYEVLSASGNQLRLKGPNPRRIQIGRSVENPAWPGEGEPRLITVPFEFALPYGCAVEAQAPSVLAGKKAFILRGWSFPDDDDDEAEFDAQVWGDASGIRQPFDLADPPEDGRYFVQVRGEFLHPQRWLNLQAPIEAQFAKRVAKWGGAGDPPIPDPPVVALKDGAGGDARILWPGMRPAAVTARYLRGGEVVALPLSGLLTTQAPSGWATTLDLQGALPADADELIVEYWAERVESDPQGSPWAGSCAHSQHHPHIAADRICVRPDCSQRASFEPACWQPGASAFALGERGAVSFGPLGDSAPERPDDAGFWSGLWTRASWILNQRYPSPEFELERPSGGGPSMATLLGSWMDDVPGGLFAQRVEYQAGQMGRRYTWTDPSGDQRHEIVLGATYSRAFDHDGGTSYLYNGSEARGGTLPWLIDAWNTGKAGRRYPWRGTGRTNVYQFGHGLPWMAGIPTKIEDAEKWVTNIREGALDPQVEGAAREAWEDA